MACRFWSCDLVSLAAWPHAGLDWQYRVPSLEVPVTGPLRTEVWWSHILNAPVSEGGMVSLALWFGTSELAWTYV